MKSIYKILVLVLLILSAANLNAQDLETNSSKKTYLPNSIHLQYAGNIGMFSFGPSWSLVNHKITIDFSLGYVPKLGSNKPIYTTAIKGFYTPNLDFKIKELVIKPLSIGFVASHTFGKRFNKYGDRNKYPKGYYFWNPANRYGLLYKLELYSKISNSKITGLSFYFETSFWDLYIYSYLANSNISSRSLTNIVTFGAGTSVFF